MCSQCLDSHNSSTVNAINENLLILSLTKVALLHYVSGNTFVICCKVDFILTRIFEWSRSYDMFVI